MQSNQESSKEKNQDDTLVKDEVSEESSEASEEEKNELSFQDKVSSAVSQIEYNPAIDQYIIPKDLDPGIVYAAKLAKQNIVLKQLGSKDRFHITALQKNQDLLIDEASNNTVLSLSAAEQEELEDLKTSDPDLWFKKRTALTNKAKRDVKEKFKQKFETNLTEESRSSELAYRTSLLAEYNQTHPDKQITDDIVTNEIPPRLVLALEKGEITFDAWLSQVGKYLNTPKVVRSGKSSSQPDMGKIQTKTGGKEKVTLEYKKSIF